MAEHDADREPEEKDAPPGEEQGPSFDEAAAWAAIVAGYGEEPPDPPGAKPFKSVEDLALLESETNGASEANTADPERPGDIMEKPRNSEVSEGSDGEEGDRATGKKADDKPAAEKPLGSSVAFPPGVGGPATTRRRSRPRRTSKRTTRATSYRPSRPRCPPRTPRPSSPGSPCSAALSCSCSLFCSVGT